MGIRLLHNLLAVREVDNTTTSAGGIQLVKAEKQNRGTVVAVGPGIHAPNGTFIATTVGIGDEVIYNAKAGELMEVDGEQLLIMPETNVVGVLK